MSTRNEHSSEFDTEPPRGLTVADVARLLRVSPDKIRRWLAKGELVAVNTSFTLAARPRWVISRESLELFRRRRSSAPLPKPPRRRRPQEMVDYFPD
jgi:hypothetical protein